MKLNPYLSFHGNCAEAFRFYEAALGGKIELLLSHRNAPGAEQTPPEWLDKVMHASMLVGDQVLMGSDGPPGASQEGMTGFSVSLQVDTPEQAERFFAALSPGATIHMALQPTFWAQRFGMLSDRFGVPWMINCPSEWRPGAA